ncbi:MAG TPA: O-antigen ligase family protein [Dongiaceae bacterium]|nr:O-antigen ligase family protein [Dongiaceae bacterium]
MTAAAPSPAELRERARQGARATSSALIPIAAAALSLALVLAFVALDYLLGTKIHRLWKLLAGGVGVAVMAARPDVGLFLFPILTPLMPLLPKLPVPGLNTGNLVVLSIFMPYAFGSVLQRRPFLRAGRLGAPIVALIVVIGLSVLRGAAFPTGYTYAAGQAGLAWFRVTMTFFVYFIVVMMVRGPMARRRIAWAVTLALLAESIYTIVFGKMTMGGRANGSLGQANSLGAYLSIAEVFALALLFGVRGIWPRLVLLATIGLGGFALMLSASRAALIATAASSLMVLMRSSRLALVVAVLVIGASPLWLPDKVKERFTSTFVEEDESDEKKLEGGAQERVDTWHTILQIVEDHALDGIGFTGLAYVLPQMGSDLGLHVKDSAHSTYLRMLSETGVIGLGVFVFLLWSAFWLGERGIRAAPSRFDRQIALGVSGGVLAMAISCGFGDRFWELTIVGNLLVACALVDDMLPQARPAT